MGLRGSQDSSRLLLTTMLVTVSSGLMNGAVAERIDVRSHLLLTALFAGVIFPIVARSAWHRTGMMFSLCTMTMLHESQQYIGRSRRLVLSFTPIDNPVWRWYELSCAQACGLHDCLLRIGTEWAICCIGAFTAAGSSWELVADSVGVIDIAGGGVVHCVGGATALAACALVGPRRKQYFALNGLVSQKNHLSVSLLLQAGFALWAGFVMLNAAAASRFVNGPFAAHEVCTDCMSICAVS
jgi:ammonia channel protein AmtB